MVTPQNIEIRTFFDFTMLVPWLFVLPILFFFHRKNYGSGFKKSILALAQFYEAMSMPYLISFISVGILAYVSEDNFLVSGSGIEKWLGGVSLSFVVLPGLIFACAYIITRQYGYVQIIKPISKLQAFVFAVIFLVTISFASMYAFDAIFYSYDTIVLIFTPLTLLLAIIIYRHSKVPK